MQFTKIFLQMFELLIDMSLGCWGGTWTLRLYFNFSIFRRKSVSVMSCFILLYRDYSVCNVRIWGFANLRRCWDSGSFPGSERSPGESHGPRSLLGYNGSYTGSNTAKQLSTHTTQCYNTLLYLWSCLCQGLHSEFSIFRV